MEHRAAPPGSGPRRRRALQLPARNRHTRPDGQDVRVPARRVPPADRNEQPCTQRCDQRWERLAEQTTKTTRQESTWNGNPTNRTGQANAAKYRHDAEATAQTAARTRAGRRQRSTPDGYRMGTRGRMRCNTYPDPPDAPATNARATDCARGNFWTARLRIQRDRHE